MILFLAAFIQQTDPPEITRMKHDLIALEQVPAQRITKPLLLCVKKRAEHHHVNKNEMGSQLAAVRSANEWLADCDIEGTRTKLIKAIRTRDPRTALSEAHARFYRCRSLSCSCWPTRRSVSWYLRRPKLL